MEVSGQLHTLSLYLWGNNLWYPLDRTLSGSWNQSGCGGEEKISAPTINPGHPPHSLVTILTELPQLHWLIYVSYNIADC